MDCAAGAEDEGHGAYAQLPLMSEESRPDSGPRSSRDAPGQQGGSPSASELSPGAAPSGSKTSPLGKDRLGDKVKSTLRSSTISDEARRRSVQLEGAMHELLSHLSLDPDGGILNLDEDSEQTTKAFWLYKNDLESALAVLATLRAILNPSLMIFFSVHVLLSYYFNEEFEVFLARVERFCNTLNVPYIEKAFIGVTFFELAGASALVMRFFYRCLRILCCPSGGWLLKANVDDVFPDDVSPRYAHMATLFWNDMPALQTFSGLKPLSYVHPDLMTKVLRHIDISSELAATVLTRFLSQDFGARDKMTEEVVSEKVTRLLLEYDGFGRNCTETPCLQAGQRSTDSLASFSREAVTAADKYLRQNPAQVLETLRNHAALQDLDFVKKQNLNHDALQMHNLWRYDLVIFLQTVMFVIGAMGCLCIGSVAFLVKICTCFYLLKDESISIWVGIAYFLLSLYQTMDLHSFNWLLKWRLETFIFGGTDARVSVEERYIMKAYRAFLVQRIMNLEEMGCFQKFCVLVGLDDDDMQQLIIEEADESKARIVMAVRMYMREHGLMLHSIRDTLCSFVVPNGTRS